MRRKRNDLKCAMSLKVMMHFDCNDRSPLHTLLCNGYNQLDYA
jgi:hypothetical protein